MAAKISEVITDSIADEVGIEVGDKLLSINGQQINDILDYQFYSQDDLIVVEIQKANQEIWSVDIEKDCDENLGLIFAGVVFDKMKVCQNRCLFCFVDQLPRGLRRTLYVRDDDYRYSFLYGNFITLTNLSEADWQKIIAMRLSPLYVSVHCIQAELRATMLKNPAAASIKKDLERLKKAGIEVHTQIVLCPGINDGPILNETITELAALYPSVISVGIVPIGLTNYRSQLPPLDLVSRAEARELIDKVDNWQKEFRHDWGQGFVYLADEFYIKAGQEFPAAVYYDDYCQIENGIGLARSFLDDFTAIEALLPETVEEKNVYLITGMSAQGILEKISARLHKIKGLTVHIIPVKNSFFGENITVTGLLTGRDICTALERNYEGKRVIIPEVVFKQDQEILLDDISLDTIKEKTGADIITVDGTASDLVRAIFE